jgi:hypothetical protein
VAEEVQEDLAEAALLVVVEDLAEAVVVEDNKQIEKYLLATFRQVKNIILYI